MRKSIKNYYRKIKALFPKTSIFNKNVNRNLIIISSLFLLSTLLIMLFAIYVLQNMLENSYQNKKLSQQKFYYWISKVEQFPNSPEVLYNAAVNSVNVGKDQTALKLLQKALEYDPLFSEAKQLQSEILESAEIN